MTVVLASIDVGSHTARLLVARTGKPFPSLTPVVRKRAYTRLAGDFVRSGRKVIPGPAVDRLAEVLEDFLASTGKHRAAEIYAAATGVLREAENRDQVLVKLKRRTGLEIRCLSGEEEAALSSLGVVYALGLDDGPHVVFDLGGGSTEIVVQDSGIRRVASLALGASVLTGRFLLSDPPEAVELSGLESEIEKVIAGAAIANPLKNKDFVIAGTGGTVTALAAAVEAVDTDDIAPERINGVRLEPQRMDELIECWKIRSLKERMSFSGLDEGRAEVVLAGAMVVRGIMQHFGACVITACMSDLLEGLIIESGEGYERK
jgi:exopolyphosphatase/guanosine-5'-triphosphate,3'-diphosphate pyrophosphatase